MTDDYAAGLFDGEGYFTINKSFRKECRSPSHQVYARVTMRDMDIIGEFRDAFGGTASIHKYATDKHCTYYTWTVCGESVVVFASRVGPLMISKRDHAELAVEFQTFKRQNLNQPNSIDRVAALEDFFQQMKILNKRGPK
ncbi:MAG: LAGLIDADG family homing endonuclease [Actinobacteria bacterium]|nr:LAGLIDADG family homing endonuclease [Actinomycetota bacterium]